MRLVARPAAVGAVPEAKVCSPVSLQEQRRRRRSRRTEGGGTGREAECGGVSADIYCWLIDGGFDTAAVTTKPQLTMYRLKLPLL